MTSVFIAINCSMGLAAICSHWEHKGHIWYALHHNNSNHNGSNNNYEGRQLVNETAPILKHKLSCKEHYMKLDCQPRTVRWYLYNWQWTLIASTTADIGYTNTDTIYWELKVCTQCVSITLLKENTTKKYRGKELRSFQILLVRPNGSEQIKLLTCWLANIPNCSRQTFIVLPAVKS